MDPEYCYAQMLPDRSLEVAELNEEKQFFTETLYKDIKRMLLANAETYERQMRFVIDVVKE